jgi:hypothetical protein
MMRVTMNANVYYSEKHAFGEEDLFTDGFLDAMLFTSTDGSGNSLSNTMAREDVPQNIVKEVINLCARFRIASNVANLLERANEEYGRGDEPCGGDFWLEISEAGCGFGARGMGDLGEALSKEAKKFGPYTLYAGDDGSLHLCKGL